jgi:afadin
MTIPKKPHRSSEERKSEQKEEAVAGESRDNKTAHLEIKSTTMPEMRSPGGDPEKMKRNWQKRAEMEKQVQQAQQQRMKTMQSQSNLQYRHHNNQQQPQQAGFQGQKPMPRGILINGNGSDGPNITDMVDHQTVNQHEQHQQQLLNDTNKLPFLVELTYEGYELASPRIIQIKSDFYELGNDKYMASTNPTNYIRIDPNIHNIEKKHCGLKKSNDNMQLLLIPYAETYINDRIVSEPTQLHNGYTVRLGKYCLFRLENPNETATTLNQMKKPADVPANVPANYGLLYDSGQVLEQPLNGHQQQPPQPPQPSNPYRALSSNSNAQQTRSSTNQISTRSSAGINNNKPSTSNGTSGQSGGESGLPGLLEFADDREDLLLQKICSTTQNNWQFKLAPVYTMYMMLRYRLSQKYKSELSFGEKLQALSFLVHKMVNYIREAVDLNHLDKYTLPYWLANSSELLYFLKQDLHLSQISTDAQEALTECVQMAFKYLVNIIQQQLDLVLISFFDPSDHIEDVGGGHENGYQDEMMNLLTRPTLKKAIQCLNEAMNLLRDSKVNAALTIQLFSQLFHYISMSLFNRLVKDQRSGLCSRFFGDKLSRRLSKIQIWAEKQGLELVADCHLQRVIQAAFFLQAAKHDIQDLSTISSNCFTLNSQQIKCLLKNYLLAQNEPPLSAQLGNNLISIAQNTVDDVFKQEGRSVQVEEETDLQLPFLLPEDGYSCEFIKGLPTGLLDFLENLQSNGHCWLWENTQRPGNWKKFMIQEQNATENQSNHEANPVEARHHPSHEVVRWPPPPVAFQPPPQVQPVQAQQLSMPSQQQQAVTTSVTSSPAIIKIRLTKKNNGLGLGIVAGRGTNKVTGIYIKSVLPHGAAGDDGHVIAGDQLLAVDDISLINVTQEKAAELMTKCGPTVLLTIAKDAAVYHNLDALLNKVSESGGY